jgi:hypothetical protein
MFRLLSRVVLIHTLSLAALGGFAASAAAQGVTTASIAGIVNDAQGQPMPGVTVVAVHQPSGSTYTAVTRGDGRYTIPGMRVGGPYEVTVSLSGFRAPAKGGISLSLGVASDVDFEMALAAVQETVTVTATVDPVFSSTRTGAATAVARDVIASLPSISGRIGDITRLTPQANGYSFGGQDDRQNNITIDGSFFNNSFGLGEGQPGGRTSVAPISLESLEQIQVNVAPYDVRQGGFIGASINSVTRSGTNQLTGSFYHRMRDESFVGTDAAGAVVNPGTFTFRNTGAWVGGPIVRNRLFLFGNYENQLKKEPLNTLVANQGGEPIGGNITRVLASDLEQLSSFLQSKFGYATGGYQNLSNETPAKRYLLRADYNLTNANKINFRYTQLNSSTDSAPSTSGSAGYGRQFNVNSGMFFEGSTYSILENIKSGVGEWTSVLGGTMSNSLIVGFTSNDESRGDIGTLFPYVDILQGGTTSSAVYATFGSEAFTPQNQLRYRTFQIQDTFTKFSNRNTMTFGFSLQRYGAENVFWSCCPQSNYVYGSLADFYADAQGSPTVSPLFFKVRYTNLPGLTQPEQKLRVWYNSAYAQNEWRPRADLTVTAGVRADVSVFGDASAYKNERAEALTFLDPDDNPVQFKTGELPEAKVLWSPRAAANWDVGGRQKTQVRVGTGLFTGPPLYVWIMNQLGNTGVLIGEISCNALSGCDTSQYGFNPNIDAYKPATVTGAGATSFELNATDPNFKFPQVWRTNVGVDQRLPWGMTGTAEFLYSKDINGVAYYNANLPVPQSALGGVDTRPRYTSNRINNTAGNVITNAFILTNQNQGSAWNASLSLSKTSASGLSLRGAYSYGVAKNLIDPGSTASSSFNSNQHSNDPNKPGLGWSDSTMDHRVFLQASYSKEYFSFGATTISAFWEAKPSQQQFSLRGSYIYGGDINGDGGTNDLIYVPRDASEMNFVQFAASGRTFTVAEQQAAFEAYIVQDPYLNTRRGQYAERGGLRMPISSKLDLSVTQRIFRSVAGRRNTGEIRLDVTNFGNMLNSKWGVGDRTVVTGSTANGIPLLTNATVDAQGRAAYRMAVANNELVTKTFQKTAFLSDVYAMMLSFRYTFN